VARGFTLIELVLALSILAIMITVLFGGLRMGLRAWQQGEDRPAVLQQGIGETQAWLTECVLCHGHPDPPTTPHAPSTTSHPLLLTTLRSSRAGC
jgi:prepilin-type N-terminal cleavage/methylation domain-containing protein